MPPVEGLRKLYEWSKFHFNEGLVQQFIKCVGLYPVGTLTRLESGFLAIIIEPGKENLLQPVVGVIYDTKKERLVSPKDMDLSQSEDRVIGHETSQKWRIEPSRYFKIA